jgi:hypothetical protein
MPIKGGGMTTITDPMALLTTPEVLRREFEVVHASASPGIEWQTLPNDRTATASDSVPSVDITVRATDSAAETALAKIELDRLEQERKSTLALAEYYYNVHRLQNDGQTALCLSGGGIRSAAFALGVLQGLARREMLSRLHYLSTVSGGGYIGSWVTAWAHRAAVANAEGDFARVEKAIGERPPFAQRESAPFRWLRANQKFLTPRSGAGSPDTWAVLSAFLRDLVLNWLVFVPLLAAATLVPLLLKQLLTFWSQYATGSGSSLVWMSAWFLRWFGICSKEGACPVNGVAGWIDSAGALLVLAGMIVGMRNRPALRKSTIDETDFRRFVLLPILVGAWLLLMAISAWPPASLPQLIKWTVIVPVIYLVARSVAAFLLRGQGPWPGAAKFPLFWEFVALAVSGAVTGATIWVGIRMLDSMHLDSMQPGVLQTALAVFGVPWLLAAFSVGFVVYTGLTSFSSFGQRDREWMARASGWYLAIAVLWVIAVGIVLIVGPWAHLYGQSLFSRRFGFATFVTLASGCISAGTALSSWTKATTSIGKVREKLPVTILANVAAIVFLIGGIALLSGLTTSLVAEVPFPANLMTISAFPAATEPFHAAIVIFASMLALVAFSSLVTVFVNVNLFSLHALYRNRLIRTFLGASNDPDITGRIRSRNKFDGFSAYDNLGMGKLWRDLKGNLRREGPFPVVNMALNLLATKNLAWQERKATNYVSTPLHTGGHLVGYRDSRLVASDMSVLDRRRIERAVGPDKELLANGANGMTLGTAMAISGAAASPNWGYHSSPAISFIMMLFNVRLGWWLGNPGRTGRHWLKSGPTGNSLGLFLQEAFGKTSDREKYIYLSDGGHFDNLGLYEMIRRRCRHIIVCDASQDPDCTLEDLGRALRQVSVDFGVAVNFNDINLRKRGAELDNGVYCAMAEIDYPETENENVGKCRLIYIKPGLYRDVPADVRAFAAENAKFPHDSTANQWFTESQFESYRALGSFIIRQLGGKGSPDGKSTSIGDFFSCAKSYLANASASRKEPQSIRIVA